mmetsp:Transcript_16078/g.32569  ORF Transcript_16078/g.32569 Transcript_16078/m.32569 type:complete len:83 (-) Transcript_16078:116-364(-)
MQISEKLSSRQKMNCEKVAGWNGGNQLQIEGGCCYMELKGSLEEYFLELDQVKAAALVHTFDHIAPNLDPFGRRHWTIRTSS